MFQFLMFLSVVLNAAKVADVTDVFEPKELWQFSHIHPNFWDQELEFFHDQMRFFDMHKEVFVIRIPSEKQSFGIFAFEMSL